MAENGAVLGEGKVILEGRYRIVQLLYKRPRLNLYLGRRLPTQQRSEKALDNGERMEPLVAIRELVLVGLPQPVQAQIEAAAFEEFVSPVVSGSARLPVDSDRVWVEGERHYLVKQLYDQKKALQSGVLTLDELLLSQKEWPAWLNTKIALNWGAQLCRIVARLHRLHMLPGYLDPATILVSDREDSPWAPVLLPSWPPPLEFWQAADSADLCYRVFPIDELPIYNAFLAPEMLSGAYDERSDIYSLGAILYLLLTHYAPSAAIYRLQHDKYEKESMAHNEVRQPIVLDESAGLELIAPHYLYHGVTPEMEQVVLRALEVDPGRRCASVFALVEALEAIIG
ncbi:MAG TPA: hypothetical protein VEL31_21050 [Ktedonobacteraceae bacterium]|nr:hypothetical protein [Ktedonobacteraceae bacterium]